MHCVFNSVCVCVHLHLSAAGGQCIDHLRICGFCSKQGPLALHSRGADSAKQKQHRIESSAILFGSASGCV